MLGCITFPFLQNFRGTPDTRAPIIQHSRIDFLGRSPYGNVSCSYKAENRMWKEHVPHLGLIKPNFVHIDLASSAASSTWFSMQVNPTLITLINLE